MMWQKKGLVFDINKYKNENIQSHASIPFAFQIERNSFRIYYSSRNKQGKSLPYYINCEIENGIIKLIGEPVGPLFDLGELGTFDDSGIMPTSVLRHGDLIYM